MVDPLRSGSESHDLGIGEGLSKSKSQHSLKSMSMPTPTPQQIDELFESLGSTFTNTTQDIDQAKESANRISEGLENIQSIFEEQVHIIRIYWPFPI